jgi:hypothetical protein
VLGCGRAPLPACAPSPRSQSAPPAPCSRPCAGRRTRWPAAAKAAAAAAWDLSPVALDPAVSSLALTGRLGGCCESRLRRRSGGGGCDSWACEDDAASVVAAPQRGERCLRCLCTWFLPTVATRFVTSLDRWLNSTCWICELWLSCGGLARRSRPMAGDGCTCRIRAEVPHPEDGLQAIVLLRVPPERLEPAMLLHLSLPGAQQRGGLAVHRSSPGGGVKQICARPCSVGQGARDWRAKFGRCRIAVLQLQQWRR